jgi:hypothetical protein
MSSKSRKRHERLQLVEPPPVAVSHGLASDELIEAWAPDWGRCCEICGRSPCVTGIRDGRLVYAGAFCGVCTWGDAACADPANW